MATAQVLVQPNGGNLLLGRASNREMQAWRMGNGGAWVSVGLWTHGVRPIGVHVYIYIYIYIC